LSLKWAFFGEKASQNQCKNRLFTAFLVVFEATSAPNVSSVPLVNLWLSRLIGDETIL
jgi:hypothetical protein